MNPSQRLFFLGLLPPQGISNSIRKIQEYFSQNYKSYSALKSPPHLTLQPPFEWKLADLPQLEENLESFTKNREEIPISLSGFAAFPPRVIYVNVIKSPELLKFYQDLQVDLAEPLGWSNPLAKKRPFAPHITVAYKDLTPPNFQLAWSEFKEKSFVAHFSISQLTLLIHHDKKWHIHQNFPLKIMTV